MKNTSILESLKKIYTKMTGKKVVKRKNETDVLSDIAETYEPVVIEPSVEVTDITNLSQDVCNSLKCGDVVVKKTGEQKHSYRVSFKKDDEGMCLTYVDASVSETVSYDLVDGTWTYNSTDTTQLGGGSQVYKHEIAILDSNDDGVGALSLLSSNNIEADSISSLSSLLRNYGFAGGTYYYNNLEAVAIYTTSSNNVMVTYNNTNATLTEQAGYSVYDTVTPL